MVDVGSLYRITYDVYDGNNALVTPSTITMQIFLPNGNSAGTTVFGAPDSTGKYHYDFQTTTTGRYTGTIATTNPITSKGFSFDVEPIPSVSLVSLASMKTYLNELGTAVDDELSEFILVATDIVEDKIGSVVRRTVTEFQPTDQGSLWLKQFPVISITSIVPYLTFGIGYDTNQVKLDQMSGRVQRLDGYPFIGGPFNVTYVAGLEFVPNTIRHAAKVIVAHLWETQRGGMSFYGAGPGPQADDEMYFSRGKEYTVPRRVLELLQPNNLGPRVA